MPLSLSQRFDALFPADGPYLYAEQALAIFRFATDYRAEITRGLELRDQARAVTEPAPVNSDPMPSESSKVTKEFINIDSDVCARLVVAPKCNNCENFHDADEQGIGICKGLAKEDWVYGSLNAGTCAAHEFKDKR